MGSPWRLREGFATSSRALHEDVAGAEGFEKPPRRLREGFAKAPRAPPFGNDSSDDDKPPVFVSFLEDPPNRLQEVKFVTSILAKERKSAAYQNED